MGKNGTRVRSHCIGCSTAVAYGSREKVLLVQDHPSAKVRLIFNVTISPEWDLFFNGEQIPVEKVRGACCCKGCASKIDDMDVVQQREHLDLCAA
jgi:hypothetical protein